MKIIIEDKEYNTKYKIRDVVYLLDQFTENNGLTFSKWQVVDYIICNIHVLIGYHGSVNFEYELMNVPSYMERYWRENQLYTKEEAEKLAEERNLKYFATKMK